MQGGGGGGQYIQELQLIVRASLPPELCCAVHVYTIIYTSKCTARCILIWLALNSLWYSSMQQNELCCCSLHCAAFSGWESMVVCLFNSWESMVFCLGEESWLWSPRAFCALSPCQCPPSSLNFGSYSLVIRQAHCQILVTITSVVVCVILLPLTFYIQYSLLRIETCFMVVTSNNNLFHVFLL